MKKKRPYKIIIAVLMLASAICCLFLPYLHLPQQEGVEDGYVIDITKAVLNSDVVTEVTEETGAAPGIVQKIAKSVANGKNPDTIKKQLNLKEEQYYLVETLSERLGERIADMEGLDKLEELDYNYFGMMKLSADVMSDLRQDVISSVLTIMILIAVVLLSLFVGIRMLFAKELQGYKLTKIITITNCALGLLGLITINAIATGALQVEKFYGFNWGAALKVCMILNLVAFLTAIVGYAHEKYSGLITWKMILKQKELFLMSIPFLVYGAIFYYGPLVGWTMAFQNYKPAAIDGDQLWVGWGKFVALFTDEKFMLAFRNTVAMSLINLVLSFFFSIAFALLLNEVVNIKGKKFVQTVSYLPHFLSWIIVAAIVRNLLTIDGGIVNDFMVSVGLFDAPINFFANPKYFWWIVGFAYIWKETGWNSIIYLSSITAINPEMYEAASIDGAGRWKKMLHITLPSIRSTIMVLLIISLGGIMNSGFEAQYQLKNDIIRETSEVIDIYVLNKSFQGGTDYSIGTAAGIFKSVVSIVLVASANSVAKLFDQERLY